MVNSGRQFGSVIGASILVVVLGKAEVSGDPSRFYELWWVAVALCAAAVVVSFGLTPKRQSTEANVTVPVVAATTDCIDSSAARVCTNGPLLTHGLPISPVGALSLLADPEILGTFDTNRAVMLETRQTRIEDHTHLDAPVFAWCFTVAAVGYFEGATEARHSVTGEGNLDSKEVR